MDVDESDALAPCVEKHFRAVLQVLEHLREEHARQFSAPEAGAPDLARIVDPLEPGEPFLVERRDINMVHPPRPDETRRFLQDPACEPEGVHDDVQVVHGAPCSAVRENRPRSLKTPFPATKEIAKKKKSVAKA